MACGDEWQLSGVGRIQTDLVETSPTPRLGSAMHVPRVIPPTAHTRHGRLPSLHASVMRLGVTLGEELTGEGIHCGDGATRLLSHGP